MFNTIAHCTTFYYYVQVLRYIFDMQAPAGPADPNILQFLHCRPKFFTIWGLVVQTLLFLLCAVHDLTRLLSKSNPIRRAARSVRDHFLVAVAGPIAITVTAMFWALFLLDRKLVMPVELDAVIPTWLNHSMHSAVLVLAIAQLLAEPHSPPRLSTALSIFTVINLAYIYTLFNEYAVNGVWIYPIFAVLDWPGRIALTIFTTLLGFSQVAIVRAAVKARWGSGNADKYVMKKRKD